jgi:ArsR family transcriptional regulator, arsenate/arsenite/antimonite-responsive transcriptional repressor
MTVDGPIMDQTSIAVNIDKHRCLCQDRTMPLRQLPIVTTAPAACCSPTVGEAMTAPDAAALAATLKALADPMRLRLMSIIAAHEGAEACVCDLTEPLGLSQPTVSHHLKVLVDAGLLTREKRGVWAYFGLVPGAVGAVVGHLGEHLVQRAAA